MGYYEKTAPSREKIRSVLKTPRGQQKNEHLPPYQASIILGVWIYPKRSSTKKMKQPREINSSWDCSRLESMTPVTTSRPLLKILGIRTHCQHHVPDPMQIIWISRTLLGPTVTRNSKKSTKRNSIRPPSSPWTSQRHLIRNVRKKAHLCVDGPCIQKNTTGHHLR